MKKISILLFATIGVVFFVGCVSSPAPPVSASNQKTADQELLFRDAERRLRAQVQDLLQREHFAEAHKLLLGDVKGQNRDLVARLNTLRKTIDKDTVVPAWVAFRSRQLRETVWPHLEAGDFNKAREALYVYGVTGFLEVDNPIFAIKLILLNAHINPTEWKVCREALVEAVDQSLADENFRAASAAIAAIRPAIVIPMNVEKALVEAASRVVTLGISSDGVSNVVASATISLDGILAPRPDGQRDHRVLETYVRELAAKEGTSSKSDWEKVEESLEKAAAWLVADDIPKDEASWFVDCILNSFQSMAQGKKETMTTAELNRRLAALQDELSSKVAEAAVAKLAAKTVVEDEEAHQLALEMAAQFAAAVDFDARIAAFVKAIGDHVEPDINRVIGDGARVLRLRRTGAAVSKADATALLVASVYMGFDDVMTLALALGADVNAPAQEDSLARPALLVALQYGWRGHAATILSGADRSVRDSNGAGAAHYAVRGDNGSDLLDLLNSGADVRTPDAEGVSPLALAADLGYARLVRVLLPFSNPAATDVKGFTALLRAAENGRLDIVRLLTAADGALLDARTLSGDGALELAALANATDLLAWLLDERNIAPTGRGVTQMVHLGNVPTLQILVAHGATLTDGHLALAAKRGHLPMVRYLVEQGLNVNDKTVKSIDVSPDIAEYLHSQGKRP